MACSPGFIFDKNPAKEFYIEESFPLDWMYPYLLPNGLILKINWEPLSSLSEDVLREDHGVLVPLPAADDWRLVA